MTTTKTYVGDIGTQIVLDCGQDISAATARSIEVRKPDGSTASWSASASGTTAIVYTTQAGSIDTPGRYSLQAHVTLPGGTWRGETVALTVYAAFG